jgi:hypothetical protein
MKRVLAVIGVLVLSATAAQAGHGGEPFAIKSFFMCQAINGPVSGQAVDVAGSQFDNNPKGITIGQAILGCVVGKLFHAGSVPPAGEIDPVPAGTILQNGLQCYNYSPKQSGPSGQPASYSVLDVLSGDQDAQQASQLRYICAPTIFQRN